MKLEDWLRETVVPLSQVPKLIPSRPNLSTCWRWSRTGCRGHVLRTFLLGNKRHTTAEEVVRFLAAINSGSRNPAGGGFSSPVRSGDERADRELRRLGL